MDQEVNPSASYSSTLQGDSKELLTAETDSNSDDIDALLQSLESDEEELEDEQLTNVNTHVPENLLQTDLNIGLLNEEVLTRRKKYGANRISEEHSNICINFLMFFVGPIQFVMEAAAILAAAMQDWVDFGVICGLLFLNALVGFLQEYHAGSIVEELKKTLALQATVLRNGVLIEIEPSDVVIGDLLQIDEGCIISADGHIVSPRSFLQVDQSSITGESLAVDKHTGDNLYASSCVRRGNAMMVVSAIGDQTFVGRAAELAKNASSGSGHFTEVLNRIGTALLVLVVLTLLVIWTVGFYRSLDVVSILRYTLAITIIGVPVGLPAVVTTTMAVGAAYLAKKKAIVQKLSAIESLAGVEILCSDKTGTLTKNRLTLEQPYTVTGVEAEDLVLTACLAAGRKRKGLDAIDQAFLKSLAQYPKAKQSLSQYKVIKFCPFDPVSKKVTAIVQSHSSEEITCVKGAPMTVLRTVTNEQPDLDQAIIDEYSNKVTEFADNGFRSLGVARKKAQGDWEILGIMPCSDPPRKDTETTVNEAKRLGLQIKMLTGDAVAIARETARKLGIGGNIYNVEKLTSANPDDLEMLVDKADGFAEVFPQHKYNVVELLQKKGYLVAMTGDGVNDAPSLKRADTGIAVEGSSDAARSAADIVFLAPGLGAIIEALKTSRQIFHRMYSYVVYRIALSLHLEIFLGLWIAILNQSLAIELVVFIAIFADIATLAIAYDNAPYSSKPVKWNLPKLWGMSTLLGLMLAGGTWVTLTTLFLEGSSAQAGNNKALGIIQNFGHKDSVVFLEIVLTENWLIFITRANGPFWSSLPSWQLSSAIFIVDVIATLFCVFGWFADGPTSIVTVVRIWVFSFGVFCACGGLYYLMYDSLAFDRVMHGRSPMRRAHTRSIDDLVSAVHRVANCMEHGDGGGAGSVMDVV